MRCLLPTKAGFLSSQGPSHVRVLCFGEILWDIIDGTAYIGGAPYNLGAHLSQMGAETSMVSSLGNDELGRKALGDLQLRKIDPRFVVIRDDAPTGTVDVYLDEKGHPDYIIHENTAWDSLSVLPEKKGLLKSIPWDVFCFGSLAQRTESNRNLLSWMLSGLKSRHVFCDINLRQNWYSSDRIRTSLQKSTIVKVNENEVVTISGLLYGRKMNNDDFCRELHNDCDLDIVLVTKGNKGAMAFDGTRFSESGCEDVAVADTVGAGDSFSAGFLYCYLSGMDVAKSLEFAGRVADYVVTKTGAVPRYSPELQIELESLTKMV